MGAADLKGIFDRYDSVTAVIILLSTLTNMAEAIPEIHDAGKAPQITYDSATTIKTVATADAPVILSMLGFPNVLQPGQFLTGGITDRWPRTITADASLDISSAGNRWGSEKASQWYAIYAKAADGDTDFTLKAMPLMRYSSEAGQVITLRNNLDSGNIGYGFTTDELVGGQIFILSGASQGLMRAITANNNNDATGGTITYSGDAFASIAQGDWFVVLPPGTNFRWIGNIYNNSSSNIVSFEQSGDSIRWKSDQIFTGHASGTVENVACFDPMATRAVLALARNASAIPANVDLWVAHHDDTSIKYFVPATPLRDAGYDQGVTIPISLRICKLYFKGVIYAGYWDELSVREYSYPAGLRG